MKFLKKCLCHSEFSSESHQKKTSKYSHLKACPPKLSICNEQVSVRWGRGASTGCSDKKNSKIFNFSFLIFNCIALLLCNTGHAAQDLGTTNFDQESQPNTNFENTVTLQNPNTPPLMTLEEGDTITLSIPDQFTPQTHFPWMRLELPKGQGGWDTPTYDAAQRKITYTLHSYDTVLPGENIKLEFFGGASVSMKTPETEGVYSMPIVFEKHDGSIRKSGTLVINIDNTIDVTANILPVAPQNLSATDMSGGIANLNWDPSGQPGNDGYTIYYKKSTEAVYPDWLSDGADCPTLSGSAIFSPLKGCRVIYETPPVTTTAQIQGLLQANYDFLVRSLVSTMPAESDFLTCPSCTTNGVAITNTEKITDQPIDMTTDPDVSNGRFHRNTTVYENLSGTLSFRVLAGTKVTTPEGASCLTTLQPPQFKPEDEFEYIDTEENIFLQGVELPGCQGELKTFFDQPVTLIIPINVSGGINPDKIHVYYFNPQNNNYEIVSNGGRLSDDKKHILVDIDHMSSFAVLAQKERVPGSVPTYSARAEDFTEVPHLLSPIGNNRVLQLNKSIDLQKTFGRIPSPLHMFAPDEYHLALDFAQGTTLTYRQGGADDKQWRSYPYRGIIHRPENKKNISGTLPGYRFVKAAQVGNAEKTIFFDRPVAVTLPIEEIHRYPLEALEIFEYNPLTDHYTLITQRPRFEETGPNSRRMIFTINKLTKNGHIAIFQRQPLDEAHAFFPDVGDREWFADFVHSLVLSGVIKGYPDGFFRPSEHVNNAEISKILVELFDLPIADEITEPPFIDVALDEWYTPYIATAKNAGVIKQDFDTPFYPAAKTSREDIVTMTLLAAGIKPETFTMVDARAPFKDIEDQSPTATVVALAAETQIIDGYPDGTFRPQALVNRAELSKIMVNAKEKIRKTRLPVPTRYPQF